MKTLFALLITLTAGFAFAHPTDEHKLNTIGVGSKLQFVQELNIPAQTPVVGFNYSSNSEDRTRCSISVVSSDRDRVIPANKTLVVSEIRAEGPSEEGWVHLYFEGNPAIKEIRCIRRIIMNNRIVGFNPPIGLVKKVLAQRIQIILAKPEVL